MSCNTTIYLPWLIHLEDVLGGKFHTGEHQFFGRRNDRKHREIKNCEQYIALEIYLKFGNLDQMKITPSEPKDHLVISIKGLITSLGLKVIIRSKISKRQSLPY